MNKTNSWEEIEQEFLRIERKSCKPVGIVMFHTGHIIDENKSVKWNNEKFFENNHNYDKEVARLNTEKNKQREDLIAVVCEKMLDDCSYIKYFDQAKLIYDYIYENNRTYGIGQTLNKLQEVIYLTNKVAKTKTNNKRKC